MNNQVEALKKYKNMGSTDLLSEVFSGNLPDEQAAAAALILEDRYPTPSEWKQMRIMKDNKLVAIRKNIEKVERYLKVIKKDIAAIEDL